MVWGGAGYTAVHMRGEGLVTQLYMCVGKGWLHSNMCVGRDWLHSKHMWGRAGYTAIHVCGVGLVTQLYMCVGRGWLHSYTCVWGGAGYTAIHVCGEGLVTWQCILKNEHTLTHIDKHTNMCTHIRWYIPTPHPLPQPHT